MNHNDLHTNQLQRVLTILEKKHDRSASTNTNPKKNAEGPLGQDKCRLKLIIKDCIDFISTEQQCIRFHQILMSYRYSIDLPDLDNILE
ncbi:unnamed protein product [Paramecium octaurelia]|uniref:Uncharacterized protein n=1 Tax=Paramecium octaurelia TaxID=43137 RepID=A0A8S1X2W2_PAROT|nr:unnamed protein product [Paramecium octaurelia]